ncbi:MAG: hypothetical protein ACE5DP_03355 [Fidelibacterota bacterium]
MKSLRLFLLFFIPLSFIPAQFYTGMKSLGGSISYSKLYYDKEENYSILNIQPTLSYFVQDNVSVGVSVNRISIMNQRNTQTLTGAGVGFKLYFSTVYVGGSYFTKKWDGDKKPSDNILGEAGYLAELSQHVYLDFGVDYWKGLNEMENTESFTVGVGVITIF